MTAALYRPLQSQRTKFRMRFRMRAASACWRCVNALPNLPPSLIGCYVDAAYMPAIRSVLRAAAFTYLAGALISLINLARWIRLLR
jgi:hypothetical protein